MTPIARTARHPIPRRSKDRIKIVPSAIAVLVSVGFILPAVWILVGSLRPDAETFGSLYPLSWNTIVPKDVSLDNYIELFSGGFALALLVSAAVCLLSVVLGLVVTVPAAYALGALRFRSRSAMFAFVVIGFMIPFEAIAIPLAQQFGTWSLSNTLIGLVLPGIGNGLAIFNLRQFFLGVPPSLREAAKLDGASEPRILWSVYLPISGSALQNSALLIFLGQWTSYLWPLLVVNDPQLRVAPIALANTFSDNQSNFGENFAGAIVLSFVPAVLMYMLQRSFGGLSMTSGEK